MSDRLNDPIAFGQRLVENLGYQIVTDCGSATEISAVQIAKAKVALFDRLVEPYMESGITEDTDG